MFRGRRFHPHGTFTDGCSSKSAGKKVSEGAARIGFLTDAASISTVAVEHGIILRYFPPGMSRHGRDIAGTWRVGLR